MRVALPSLFSEAAIPAACSAPNQNLQQSFSNPIGVCAHPSRVPNQVAAPRCNPHCRDYQWVCRKARRLVRKRVLYWLPGTYIVQCPSQKAIHVYTCCAGPAPPPPSIRMCLCDHSGLADSTARVRAPVCVRPPHLGTECDARVLMRAACEESRERPWTSPVPTILGTCTQSFPQTVVCA